MIADTADVVVVGAGSAGTVVSHRLATSGRDVVLMEAGSWATGNPLVDHPPSWFALQGTDLDWDYQTEPAADVRGRRFRWPRGKAVGGSSVINGMIWLRGNRMDFDTWNQLGCDGWSYEDLLPYFRKSEQWGGEPSRFHGVDGEIHVRHDPAPSLAARAFVQAAERCGYPVNGDFNGESQFGAGFIPHSIRDSVRESVATAFFPDERLPDRLRLLTGVRAQRLILQDGRCLGVEYVEDGETRQIHAGETILSAGALETPKLLMLSGIGPRRHLRELGISPALDLPVGRNLQDHPAAAVCVASDVDLDVDPLSPLGEAALFTHSRPGLSAAAPDLLITIAPFVMAADAGQEEGPLSVPGFTLMPYVARPQSRGRVTLRSADPADAVRIDTGYLRQMEDREVLRRGVGIVFDLLAEEPLRSLVARYVQPVSEPRNLAEVDQLIDESLFTFFHPVGTCPMGRDEGSVVDPDLRVHGLSGLSVVDASVMPRLIAANTNAAVIAIAERAAALRT